MAVEQDGFIIPDNVLELARQREARPTKPKAEPGIVKRAGLALADAAARFAAPVEGGPRQRGGLSIEGKPYGAGDARVVAAPPQAPGSSVLDRPAPPEMLAEQAPPSVEQGVADSVAPWKREQDAAIGRYRAAAGAPNATPFSTPQNIAQDLRQATDNPVVRGAVAGVAQLGQTGVGAVRLVADLFGADKVAGFAAGASNAADTIGQGATADLRGNNKLVADVTSSIINSAPSVALATVGGPALSGLFVQSTLAEYNNGRDAGFDPDESIARAGIMGAAEAIGERFGLPEQVKLLKSVGKHVPTGQLAQVFGSMLAKEIPGEQLTTGLQFLADKAGPAALNPNATLADYLNQAGETLKLTIAQTAVMGGGPAALGATQAGIRRADAAVDRSGRSRAENVARDGGLIRPTEMRAKAFGQLDDLAATHGIPSRVVKILKEEADGKPLAGLGAWLQRALRNLAEDGHIAPVDDAALSALSGQPANQPPATPRFDAGNILEGPAPAAVAEPSPPAQAAAPGSLPELQAGPGVSPSTPPAEPSAPGAPVSNPQAEPAKAPGFDPVQLQTGQLLQIAQNPTFPAAVQTAAAAEVRRRETDAMYAERDQQREAELGAVLDESRSQQADQAAAAGRAGELDQPTAMQLALQRAQVKPIAGPTINRNWTAFSADSGTLGIPREQMPQVSAEHRGALVNFLRGRGIGHQAAEIQATDLKPTQAEFSPQKVKGAADFKGGDRSILVSADGYVLDGHHQWMAKREAGEPIKAIVLDAPIQDLLRLTHQFPSSTTAGGPRRSAPNAQPLVLPVADALPAESGDGRLPDAGGGLPGPGPAGQQLAGVGGAAEAPGAPSEAPAALPDGSGPATALTPEPQADAVQTGPASAPPAETFAGNFGRGMSQRVAQVKAREFARTRPDMTWTVAEVPDDPKYEPGRYLLVGKQIAPAPSQPQPAATDAQPASNPSPSVETAAARAEEGAATAGQGADREAGTAVLSGARPAAPEAAGLKPRRQPKHPDQVRGSQALAAISRSLGGISPQLLGDLSQKVSRERVSKLGKRTLYTTWDNPAIPGVGSLFRAGGTSDLTELARVLEDEGYIPAGTLERDYLEARSLAQDIIKAELAQGGSSVRVGDPEAVDAEMTRRREEAMAAEPDPWEDFAISPDDLDNAGFSKASPETKALTEQLMAEAQTLGIDTESIAERAALETESDTEDAYHERAQQLIRETVAQAGQDAAERDAGAEGGSSPDSGQASGETGPPGGDRADGPDGAVQAEGLTPERKKVRGYGDLEAIAGRLGISVFKAGGGWHSGGNAVDVPDADVDVVMTGAVSPAHVFAHELGHAIMQKRGFSFKGFPKAEMIKRIGNYEELVAASKAFRPGVHEHENPRYRRHALKPDEVLADALASVLIGQRDISLVRPLMDAVGLTERDMGLVDKPGLTLSAPTPESLKAADQKQRAAAAADAKEQKRLADKAKADAEVGEFRLTGSDRAADVAAAAGQEDLFSASAESAAPASAPAAPPAQAPARIDDVGEKIGGARKDTAERGTGSSAGPRRNDDDRPAWMRRFQISQITASRVDSEAGRWVIRDTRSLDWLKQARQVGRNTYATREEAEAALPLAAVSMKHRVVPTREGGYEIWRDVSDRKRVKVVDRTFDTREDALAYMAQHAVEIIEANTTFGEADLPVPADKRRVGPERRTGDVDGQAFRETFGFRGVEFGNWNNQAERQELMNEAYDGLLDLADVMGVPPKALSLNGDLALAFGARGQGLSGARAHYETNRVVMNLTKMKGAGALAHEWFHALDHYLGRQDGKASSEWVQHADGTRSLRSVDAAQDMVSSGFRGERSGVRAELRAAYREVMNAIAHKAEKYVEDTARADKFVAQSREEVVQRLAGLRRDLAEQRDTRYYKRNNKPASAEQLAQFDAVAQAITEGVGLASELRRGDGKLSGARWSNDALDQLSAIYKAVRGRSGFDGTNHSGIMDRLRGDMERYSQRLKMLAEAQQSTEKVKQVPTDFAMDARSLDQGRGTDYWTSPHEMAARAFQGFVEDKLSERGGQSPFLNYAPANVGIPTPWGWKRPYPAGEERVAINRALQKFVDTLQTREDEQGRVALFSRRDSTPVDMPPVAIGGGLSLASLHPRYAEAKAGDAAAALELARDVVSSAFVEEVRSLIGDAKPIVQPVASIEESGRNKIPLAVAHVLADRLGLTVGDEILQASRPKRTSLDGLSRLFATPEFDGPVQAGASYLLVDDTLTQGGTYAALASHIRQNGGQVVGAAALTGKRYSATMALSPQLLQQVRDRYADVEPAFRAATGYGFDALTESEARYLAKHNAPDTVRARIAQERDQAGQRLDEGGAGQEAKPLSSRGAAPAGVDADVLRDWAAATAKRWADAPTIRVAASVQALPGEIREWIASADAEGSVRALMLPDTNEVWLVASQLGSMQEAQFALFHEVFGHVGLRKVMGDAYETRLAQLRAANPALRAEARAWMQRNSEAEIQARMGLGMSLAEASREVQFLSIEEALADRAGNPQDLTGWQRFAAALQTALRRIGLDAVANWMERAGQAETLKLLADARDAVAGRPQLTRTAARAPSAAPAFSRADELTGTSGADEAAAVQRGYRDRVTAALGRVDHVINGLGGLPDTDQFLAQRYRALGKIAHIDQVANEIRTVFRKAAPEEKRAIYAYLTDAAGRAESIPTPAVREMAVAVKGYINTVGDQLVARGLLPEAAREEYRDRYLPRLYLAHLLQEGDWRSIGAGKKVSDLSYLKRRKDIPQEIRDVLLGEVKDPAFLAATAIAKPMRDMALLDWLQQISEHQAWIYPQSLAEWAGKRVSPFWLRAEAAALRERARLYPEEVNREKAGRVADQMDALASETLTGIDLKNEDFKQLPDTARYGRLRGLLVRREIYDDLMGTQDFMPADPGWAQRVLGYGGVGTKATQLWKMSKVALNIPGQIRNAVGNAVMLQLSGVPLAKMPGLMARAIREVRRGGPAWDVAKRYGVTESTFQAQELYRARRDLLELERDLKGMSPWLAIKTFATRIADLAGDAYQGTEAVFKTLKIMHGLDTGLSEERAALEAQKWLFDYSLIDRNLRYLRNAPVGAPFVTFSAKVLPRLAEVALLHPQRFLPWVGLMYGMQAWAQAVFGGDDDEWKHLKEALPKWMQDKGHIAFLPFRDDAGRLQAADLSYFFPWSQWTELGSNLAKGELGAAIKNFGIFGGPVPDLITAMKTGKDSFTGRDIINPNDPTSVQAAAYLAYVWDMAMPPMISSNGVVSPLWLLGPEYGGKLAQAATGATNRRGDPRATGGQAAARLVGLNVYGIDPVLTRQANLAQMATSIKLTRLQLRSKLSDQGLTAEQKAEILAKYMEKLKELAKEMDDYSKRSQVPDFARREKEVAD